MGIESITGKSNGKPWEVPLDLDFGNSIWKDRKVEFMHRHKSFLREESSVVRTLNKLDHKLAKTIRLIVKYESPEHLREIRNRLAKLYQKADELSGYSGGNLDIVRLLKLRFDRMFAREKPLNMKYLQDRLETIWPKLEGEVNTSQGNSGPLTIEDLNWVGRIKIWVNEEWLIFQSFRGTPAPPSLIDREYRGTEDNQPRNLSNANQPPRLTESERQIQRADRGLDQSNSNQTLLFQDMGQSNTAGDQRSDNDSPDALQALQLEEAERIFENLTNLTFQGDQGEKEK